MEVIYLKLLYKKCTLLIPFAYNLKIPLRIIDLCSCKKYQDLLEKVVENKSAILSLAIFKVGDSIMDLLIL